MSFLKRLFSADYRAALSAEAAGDLELAAQRYALAGHHEAAARMHVARAERAEAPADEIEALRDALHWAEDGGPLRRKACAALGRALLSRSRAEGVATERDRERVREAARLLAEADEWQAAGEAWESIGRDQEAASAYKHGGLVERLEKTLARDSERSDRERSLRDAFRNYELHMRAGDRDAARDDLRECVEIAEKSAEYRRLLDELESRLITGGRVVLRPRNRPRIVIAGSAKILIGRDGLCDLVLRSGGVSRRHAEVRVAGADAEPSRFSLRDAGSRNGTLVGGMPISGSVPLIGDGRFALGEVYEIEYRVSGSPPRLCLRVVRGFDQGALLLAGGEKESLSLSEPAEIPLTVELRNGRPYCEPERADGEAHDVIRLNGEAARGPTQLIHGDQLVVAGVEIEVA